MLNCVAALLVAAVSFSAAGQPAAWKEFMSGQRSTYTTLGNPKARGLEVTFDHPRSWDGAEGKRPNTLYQVTSDAGRGLELCNLVIRELPETLTKQDLAELFDPSELKDLVPSGGHFINGARTTIDGQPAAWVHFSHEMDRAGMKLRLLSIMYPVYFDKKLIIFSCSVGDSASKPPSELQKRYRTNLPLFQQLANTLVIHTKWKRNR